MKTSFHHALIGAALTVVASVPCHLTAQTAAPAAPAGGTGTAGGRVDPATNRTTTTQSPTTGTTTNRTVAPNASTTTTGTGAAPRTSAVQPAAGTTTNQTATSGQNTTTTATTPGAVSTTSGNTALPNGTTSSSGTISSFGASDFSLQAGPGGTPGQFTIGEGTQFVDLAGNPVPRERFFRRGSTVPATVFYSRSPEGTLIASRVVLNESVTSTVVESAGTITEVSPGILVIEQPGASDTPVRYVNNKTTNYVNENGEPVLPESVKAGTPVKIFYTKVGDTLVASKVEVGKKGASGLPKPPVEVEKSTTTTTKKSIKEKE